MNDSELYFGDIVQQIDAHHNILFHAPGGVGKTYTLKRVGKYFKSLGWKVCFTALTGVAALNLYDPALKIPTTTLHKWAGMGLAREEAPRLLAKILHDQDAKQRWSQTQLLVIDEISMWGAELFEKMDFIARRVRRRENEPFGGLQLLLSGDFLQLPPIKQEWIFMSTQWGQLKLLPYVFNTPKRFPDTAWFELLLRVRKSKQTKTDINILRSRVDAYHKWKEEVVEDTMTIKPTTLYSRKMDVYMENMNELDKLEGTIFQFQAKDSFDAYTKKGRSEYYEKMVEEDIPSSIILKVGAQVMLKKNLDVTRGLANGSRGVVTNLGKDYADVKFLNGKQVQVKYAKWEIEDKDGLFVRSQIPLILAWATTIHKSQGSSIDLLTVDLGPSVFAAGQASVALSRVKTLEGLFISDFYDACIRCDPKALSISNTIDRQFAEREIELVEYKLVLDSS
jgi:ATP-dependent DNA helicase PIF1